MAKWSIALFGYNQNDPTGKDIKRGQPGDIVAWKPYENAHIWTPLERKLFLIVSIDGVTKPQTEVLCELEYDLDSYRPYETPLIYTEWLKSIGATVPEEKQEKKYADYTLQLERDSAEPIKHWRKRRFCIPMVDLESKGVNLTDMTNKELQYEPKVDINHTEIYDKLLQRKVALTDTIEGIKPRTLGEIIENKSAETILSEVRA